MSDFSENAQENPASKADGKSLALLFRTDPMDLTKEERQEIIQAMRKQRTEFVTQEKSGKKGKKKASAKKSLNLDIDDLDIEL